MSDYDITFCKGKDCARKEECHRYRELLRFRADKDPNKKTCISMCKPTDTTKCTLFWREKGNSDGED